jgi:hypothetical protein
MTKLKRTIAISTNKYISLPLVVEYKSSHTNFPDSKNYHLFRVSVVTRILLSRTHKG